MKKPKKVLILGSGGLKIGQAGEFDYSGSQAIKALKEEGVKVVLINPNIATIQTDEKLADTVYFLPLTEHFATQVIKKERPDSILLSFGGQTALNLGLALEKGGVLKKYKVRVLGTPVSTIRDTEDRDFFVRRLKEIGVSTPRSHAASNIRNALKAAEEIGYPVMVRAGFALGGEGSGVVRDAKTLAEKLKEVFRSTPQVLIEEYVGGWKEIEYEVVRDRADNCITVCNMENIDPMGIHTGESMVVAPSQTLTNEEYHRLREIAIRVVRHLGVVGECNIQYALHPKTGDYRVIEVNARLSRSSALASKATGYPLAFVAAKLALGYTLPELKNSVTQTTTACFEPALDYLVLKLPRWDLTKFEHAAPRIGTEMKSVGEVMAVGRSFEEVLQKALRMLATPLDKKYLTGQVGAYLEEIKHPTTNRLFAIFGALRKNVSVKKLHALSGIDPWFLEKMKNIVKFEQALSRRRLDSAALRKAKQLGFSDVQIATSKHSTPDKIRALRKKYGVLPAIKQIDTLAGEFPAKTNYLYLTYHGEEHDVVPAKRSAVVLGSGPYAIGSSVEFDWSGVQALQTLSERKYQTIMVNYNPETVSTDYDMSDRLYFEELSLERVLDIIEFERPKGVVVSTGGQIPNNLALPLHRHGARIFGTHPTNIDRAENRHTFSKLLDKLNVDQPPWAELRTLPSALKAAERIGYPVLVRPSYVLSGAAMSVAINRESLAKYLKRATDVSPEHPVVISKFIENAREIEIDGVAAKGKLMVYAITEHIENAGTHSGDATVVLPPQRTYLETIRRAKDITKQIIRKLKITGPFNIQFIAKDNRLQVIECNVRASRSFPFVSKVTGYNFIDIATRAMLGENVAGRYRTLDLDHIAVKSPQFSYGRIKGADPTSRVEMASTGEVACFGDTFGEALLKSMMAAGFRLPKSRRSGRDPDRASRASGNNILLSIGGEESKLKLLASVETLAGMGFRIHATENTADFFAEHGITCDKVWKISSKREPSVLHLIENGKVDLIVNIPTRAFERENTDGFMIRRKAVDMNIPLITNRQLAEAFVTALAEQRGNGLKTKSWAEYRAVV
ncbi:carbamoyl phosphate synthase large subunit [Candidatus Kaiserbacteria bacterium RIFCSPLOWO2_01_FULL_54_13]|uniref:Carbamoyl phosphate synthase large subunit n=1 Tax=Candidatus Kaiserbacteria bacterium RIFCSPLOWO2_01_FULL_54_13 TaxID=1798512 RepID=A0A1F6F3K1_9BACT|nr:MAG: carbamoyl phosphate synthase large subunit [Candidatus Kaiserbacteria bacterium RIFCSPLOWO2_01_FULL_54_13]